MNFQFGNRIISSNDQFNSIYRSTQEFQDMSDSSNDSDSSLVLKVKLRSVPDHLTNDFKLNDTRNKSSIIGEINEFTSEEMYDSANLLALTSLESFDAFFHAEDDLNDDDDDDDYEDVTESVVDFDDDDDYNG